MDLDVMGSSSTSTPKSEYEKVQSMKEDQLLGYLKGKTGLEELSSAFKIPGFTFLDLWKNDPAETFTEIETAATELSAVLTPSQKLTLQAVLNNLHKPAKDNRMHVPRWQAPLPTQTLGQTLNSVLSELDQILITTDPFVHTQQFEPGTGIFDKNKLFPMEFYGDTAQRHYYSNNERFIDLDMRLADLSNEKVKERVTNLRKLITKKKTVFAVGVSGCGKTRLLFDYAQRHWSLYFELVGNRVGQYDCKAFREEVHRQWSKFKRVNQERAVASIAFQDYIDFLVVCLITARLVTLLIFKAKNTTATAKDWLLAQLGGQSFESFIIFKHLRNCPEDQVRDLFTWVETELLKQDFAPDILCDEAHELNADEYGEYLKATFPHNSTTCSPLSRAIYVVSQQLNFPSVWAGTSLALGDINASVQPSTVTTIEPDTLASHLFLNFEPLSKLEVEQLLDTFLIDLNDDLKKFISAKLCGRARMVSTFIVELWKQSRKGSTPTTETIKELVQLYETNQLEVTSDPRGRTLADCWRIMFDHIEGSTASLQVFDALFTYFIDGTTKFSLLRQNNTLIDLSKFGVAFLRSISINEQEESYTLCLDEEPWLLEAFVEYIRSPPPQLPEAQRHSEIFLRHLRQKAEEFTSPNRAAVNGFALEKIFALFLLFTRNLGNNIFKIAQASCDTLPSWLFDFCDKLNKSPLFFIKYNASLSECLSLGQWQSTIYQLNDKAGPDLYFNGCFCGMKSTQSDSVSAANLATLDPKNYDSAENFGQTQQQLYETFKGGTVALDLQFPSQYNSKRIRIEPQSPRLRETEIERVIISVDDETIGTLLGADNGKAFKEYVLKRQRSSS